VTQGTELFRQKTQRPFHWPQMKVPLMRGQNFLNVLDGVVRRGTGYPGIIEDGRPKIVRFVSGSWWLSGGRLLPRSRLLPRCFVGR
jgi:hypothetical protein